MKNKVILFVGIVLATLLALYFLVIKKKTNSDGTETSSTGNSFFDMLTGKKTEDTETKPEDNKNATGNTGTGNTGTGTGNTSNPPPVIYGPSQPIATKYYYATIYLKFDGYTAPSGAIGYLSNGQILYYSQVEYVNGRYEDRQNVPDVPPIGTET